MCVCVADAAVQDKVLGVEPEQTLNDGGSATGGQVTLASGAILPYDWLVVALGASADPRGVPGIKEYARPFNTLADAGNGVDWCEGWRLGVRTQLHCWRPPYTFDPLSACQLTQTPVGSTSRVSCPAPVTLADAEFVAGRLAAFEARAALGQQEQATVVVVGAGYAGVELAAVVGERMRGKASVVLVTPGGCILESAPAGQRQAAEEVRREGG